MLNPLPVRAGTSIRKWRLEAALTGTLEAYLHEEGRMLNPLPVRAGTSIRNWRLEAALTGTLEAYLHEEKYVVQAKA